MSKTRSTNLCAYTFADGRRCRMPRRSGHPYLCCFHARKEAQAQAAEEVGRDVSYFLSGDFLSACDLSLALGRVFAGAARGHFKPKTAGTLAYLGQTLLQTIQLAQHEYINAFSTDDWRDVISSHVEQNGNYLAATPPPAPAPLPAQTPEQLPVEAASQNTHPNEAQTQTQDQAPDPERGSLSNLTEPVASAQPTDPDPAPPSMTIAPSTQSPDSPAVAGSSPAPSRLPLSAAEFAASILASARSSTPQHPRPQMTKAHSAAPAALSDSPPLQSPKPAAAPPASISSIPSRSSPLPTLASELPGFGAPANWEVLIPQMRGPVSRRRQIRPWYVPE